MSFWEDEWAHTFHIHTKKSSRYVCKKGFFCRQYNEWATYSNFILCREGVSKYWAKVHIQESLLVISKHQQTPSTILPSSPSCLSQYSSGYCSNAAFCRGLCVLFDGLLSGAADQSLLLIDSRVLWIFLTLVGGFEWECVFGYWENMARKENFELFGTGNKWDILLSRA